MEKLQNFFAGCSFFELNEMSGKQARQSFLPKYSSSPKLSTFWKIETNDRRFTGRSQVAALLKISTPFGISQMKQEFTCLCGCYHQDFVPQNRSNSLKYKKTRHKCKVTHFAGLLNLILC